MANKIVIGKEEWCSLPALSLPAIKVKIDSGAATSALHAFNIRIIKKDSMNYVSFDIHPIQNNRKLVQQCIGKLIDTRYVKSSSGEKEKRYVISTTICMGEEKWEIQITLTNRDSMGYRMLLGREAINEHILIDPNASFCLGDKSSKDVESHYSTAKRGEKKLSIALLASNPNLYSNKRIMEAAEERGHFIKFINIQQCFMNITSANPEIHYRGDEVLNYFDAVIPRIKPSMTFYGCSVVLSFEFLNTYCLNSASAISNSRDKLRSLQLLSKHGLPMPCSGFANSPIDTKSIINMIGGAPIIIKLLEGTQGKGVVLAETNKAAESVINAFKSLKANILVQECIKESMGRDLRCFVVGNKVVGAIERVASTGEFRANLHLGGAANPIKLTSEEKKIAIKAAKVMGLQVAGVDLIRSNSGPKILEINSSPGLEGVEIATEKDIAGLMIEAIEVALGS